MSGRWPPAGAGRRVENWATDFDHTEEFLRAYAPVTMARMVARDFDFHGHPLKEGDWLLLPFPAANRDPSVFENLRRGAAGPGKEPARGVRPGTASLPRSSLARMELRVALQEWMARYPDFELSDPAAVTWSGGQVRGPRTLPVTIL